MHVPTHTPACLSRASRATTITQTVENVLAECGQDIDAAIQRLTQLKLGAEQQASANGSAAAANGSQQQQQAQQRQQQDASTPAAAGAAAADTAVPQTADQWVDALVQEMAAAKDFTDARGRAGKLLQAFEQFVTARNKDQVRRLRQGFAAAGGVLCQHPHALLPALTAAAAAAACATSLGHPSCRLVATARLPQRPPAVPAWRRLCARTPS
jgi:hypothetical protein